MNTIDKIIESPLISEPWDHKIVDNFFEPHMFEMLQSLCENLYNSSAKNNIFDPALKLHSIYADIDPLLLNSILKINKELLNRSQEIFQTFAYHRHFISHVSIPDFHICKPNLGEFYIHDEQDDKALSIVVYISPKVSSGTKIYKSKDQFVKQIEWLPNRALIFCGETDKTWHSFGSDHYQRCTLNYFLKRRDFIDFTETQDFIDVLMNDKSNLQLPKTDENIFLLNLFKQGLITE